MKEDITKILACPVCLNSLKLEAYQSKDEVVEGVLQCSRCDREYPVKEKIPRLIPGTSSKYSNDLSVERERWQKRGKAIKEETMEKYLEVRDANINYHDVAADTYEEDVEESIHQNQFNQKRIEKIISDLSQKAKNDYFLDIGCGTGNLPKFGQKYFKNAIGIDVSVGMLRIAKERSYEVIQADASFLPFKENIFDTISVFSVLHHLYDYTPFLSEASRILKSQGFLYTDWDPQKRPKIDENRLNWRAFKLLKFSLKPLKGLVSKINSLPQSEGINLREIRPETKKLYEIAEYHNLGLGRKKRGIDFDKLKRALRQNNFTNVQPTFHWEGKTISQLSIFLKIGTFFLKFQGYPLERFMENIMIIAQKK